MTNVSKTFLLRTDDLLRGRAWAIQQGRTARRLTQLALLLIVFGLTYGAVMGSYFSPTTNVRPLQMTYSALKVPLLLSATFLLSLPTFFVMNSLFGLRGDFARAVRALTAAQAGLTIILASLAPLTFFWYLSCSNYSAAILFNTLMFGLASFLAQYLLRRFYRPLIEKDRRHRLLLRVWLVIYAFVGIQMGWVLRPFIGDPAAETHFFRQEAWGNAYVKLVQIAWRLIGG